MVKDQPQPLETLILLNPNPTLPNPNLNLKLQQEQQQLIQQQQLKKKKRKIKAFRYKTELCKNYEETGFCNYLDKCEFAHGRHELQKKTGFDDPRYKTQECYMYFYEGTCPYGRRCIFKHDDRSVEQIKNSFVFQNALSKMGEVQLFQEEITEKEKKNALVSNKSQSRIFNEWSGHNTPETSENGDDESFEILQLNTSSELQQKRKISANLLLSQLPNFETLATPVEPSLI